jgi:Fic family protein
MSRGISCQWPGNPFAPYRQGRMPCGYEAYVPDLLAGRAIMLDGDVAADVTEAEVAIGELNAAAFALADMETLARLLLRAESVASSRIEGLEVEARKLLRAEAARAMGVASTDITVNEVLGNI